MKSGLWPLAVIWLAVHAALLAVILGAKFLFTKTVLMTMLAMGVLAFLFSQIRAKPRKLFHSP
ncbi:MAG TPA: hypothetical protein VNX61_12395 [Rhizomicrobium sp.]|nr:hypothetical protein [Rhizomicrobium sp.]